MKQMLCQSFDVFHKCSIENRISIAKKPQRKIYFVPAWYSCVGDASSGSTNKMSCPETRPPQFKPPICDTDDENKLPVCDLITPHISHVCTLSYKASLHFCVVGCFLL
ncbi:hypothetical protein M758_UG331400 [Ceratodon purpureus]|nr:hypothetical protein M758_UG331400 [Ceratodon purpureus]